jgi:hypothetical protein
MAKERIEEDALTAARTRYAHLKIDTSPITEEGAKSAMEDAVYLEANEGSITPRTLIERAFVVHDTGSIVESAAKILESIKVRLTELEDEVEAKVFLDEGLVTSGKYQQALTQAQKQKSELKPLLRDIANKELAKLETGVEQFALSSGLVLLSFVDRYVNSEGTEILRHGIKLSDELGQNIKDFNGLMSRHNSTATTKSSAKSSSSKKSKASDDTDNFIHFVELDLIKHALQSMSHDERPVLIDVFARNADGNIKFLQSTEFSAAEQTPIDSNIPEVHTIVLYKMPNSNQVLMIDPSNSEYTRHFALGHSKVLIEQVTRNAGLDYELISYPKKIQIYKQPKEVSVGPQIDQARDCIDVATKLAFEITKSPHPLEDPGALGEWLPVVRISNSDTIDRGMLFPDIAIRIKQSSSNTAREKFSVFMTKFRDLVRICESTENDALNQTAHEKIAALKKLLSPTELYKGSADILYSAKEENIISLYTELNTSAREHLQSEEQQVQALPLLGMEVQNG